VNKTTDSLQTNLTYLIAWFFSRASDYGLVKVDDRGNIIQFSEKPKGADLKAMVIHNTITLMITPFCFLVIW
jgi:ADP-glucose pyrophosphorylase